MLKVSDGLATQLNSYSLISRQLMLIYHLKLGLLIKKKILFKLSSVYTMRLVGTTIWYNLCLSCTLHLHDVTSWSTS